MKDPQMFPCILKDPRVLVHYEGSLDPLSKEAELSLLSLCYAAPVLTFAIALIECCCGSLYAWLPHQIQTGLPSRAGFMLSHDCISSVQHRVGE